MKTSKSPVFRGGFQVPYMRWQVQKLVFVTPADMIDQKYQSKQMTQRQKCSKTAAEVEKKVTAFGENIRPGQCQPFRLRCPLPMTPNVNFKTKTKTKTKFLEDPTSNS